MIKKILLALFILLFALGAMFACKGGEKSDNDNSNNQGGTSVPDTDNSTNNDNTGGNSSDTSAIWDVGITVRLLVSENTKLTISDLTNYIGRHTDKYPIEITDDAPLSDHEFIFGESERALYKSALRELRSIVDIENGEHGWLAYSDGKSVAVAYSSAPAMAEAAEYIKQNWLQKSKLSFDTTGVVASATINLEERAAEARVAYRAKEFARIKSELGEDTAKAFQKLYTLFSDDVYIWLANLFEPNICVCTGLSEDVTECQHTPYCGGAGFYFNNDGRDTVGYLPDIESTVQALHHLNSGGMFDTVGGSYVNAFPQEYLDALLKFAKSLQSSEDGYFYHPQWGTNIIAARRGRDLGWAQQLIDETGGKPYWTTPGGVAGELGAPGADAVQPVSALTSKLSASVAIAVSQIKSASSLYLPDYLRSLSAWKTYIDELNIINDPYTAGNTLAAMHNEIKSAGDAYINYLTSYLTENQNQETGFWGEGVTFVTMNGFMKLSYSFSYYNRVIPNVEKAFMSTIDVLLTPDTEERDLHVCNTYNTWVNFNQIFNSLKKVEGGEAKIEELRAILREKAPELINITYDKYLTHRQPDGTFSYHEKAYGSASQGAPVAPGLRMLGDVNATSIVTTGTTNLMFSVLGVQNINFYLEEDMDYFMSEITNLDPVIKNKAPDVETQTFDRYDPTDIIKGVEISPSDTITNAVMDTTELNGVYKYFGASVVKDPIPSSSADKALKVNSYVYEDGYSAVPTYSYSFISIMNNVMLGNMYSLEFDFLVTEAENKLLMEIGFVTEFNENTQAASAFTVNLIAYKGSDGKQYLKLVDKYAGTDGIKAKLVDGIPLNAWNNLKIDLYVIKTTEEGTTKSNYVRYGVISLNDKIVAISEASATSGGVVKSQAINACTLAYAREAGFEIYIDNVHAEEFIETYTEPTIPELSAPDNAVSVTTKPAGTGVYYNDLTKRGNRMDFNGKRAYLPAVDSGPGDNYYIVNPSDPTDRYHAFYRTGASTVHTYIINEGYEKNEAELKYENPVNVLEMDILFANLPASASNALKIRIAEYWGGADLYIGTNADGTIRFHNVVEDSRYVPMEQNKWYNIRFEYYPISYVNKQARIQVYIDGEFAVELSGVDVGYYPKYTSARHKTTFQLQSSAPNGTVIYDNYYYGYDNKEYVMAKEPVPDGIPTINGTHTGGPLFGNTSNQGSRYEYNADTPKPLPDSGTNLSKTYVTEEGYLWFYNYATASNNAYISYSNPSLITAEHLMYIMETDFAIGNVPNGKDCAGFFTVRANGFLTKIYFGANAEGKIEFSHATGVNKDNSFAQNEWHNIKFEVYYLSDWAYPGMIFIKVYVDGNFFCDIQGPDISDSTSNTTLTYIQSVSDNAWIALDNIYIGFGDKEYVPDEGVVVPEEPERLPSLDTRVECPEGVTGTHTGGAAYNSDISGKRYGFDLDTDMPIKSSSTSSLISYITTDKYLLFTQRAKAQAQVKINFGNMSSAEEAARKGNVFETDIFFDGVSELTTSPLLGRFILYSSDGAKTSVYFGYDAAAKKITIPGVGSVIAGSKLAINPKEWTNLRFEYWVKDGAVIVKIYVNGIFAVETTGADTKTDSVNRVDFYSHDVVSGFVVGLDNLYLGYTAEEYVTSAPGSGGGEEEEGGGDTPTEPTDTRIEPPEGIAGTHTGGSVYLSNAQGNRLGFDEITSAPLSTSNSTNAPSYVTKDAYLLVEQKTKETHSMNIPYPTLSAEDAALRKGNVFEADVMLGGVENMTSSGLIGRFILHSQDGQKTSVYFYYNVQTKLIELPKWGTVSDGAPVTFNPNEWNNLRFEYWYVDGNLQIKVYLNGVYKAEIRGADSSNATTNTSYFYFHNITTGIYVGLDNIYTGYTSAEYDGVVKPEVGEDEPGESVTDTQYSGNFEAEIDGGITTTVTDSSKMTAAVVDSPLSSYDGDKALKISTTGNDTFVGVTKVPLTSAEIGNRYTLTFDLYHLSTGPDTGNFADFVIKNTDGKQVFKYNYVYQKSSAESSARYIRIMCAGGDDSNGNYLYIGGSNTANRWVNIRIDMFLKDGKWIAQYFMDDVFVAEDRSAAKVSDTTALGYLEISHITKNTTFYYDNFSFVSGDGEYSETPATAAPDITGTKGNGVYYNAANSDAFKVNFDVISGGNGRANKNYDVGPAVTSNYLTAKAFNANGFAYAYKTGVMYKDDGVTINGNYHSTIKYSGFGNAAADQNLTIVEFDMAVAKSDYALPIVFSLRAGGVSADFYVGYTEADGVGTITFNNATLLEGKSASIALGQWYNIRLEMDSATLSDGKVTANLYINNELVGTVKGLDAKSYSSTSYLGIQLRAGSASTQLCYDNLYIGYSKTDVTTEE